MTEAYIASSCMTTVSKTKIDQVLINISITYNVHTCTYTYTLMTADLKKVIYGYAYKINV